MMNVRSKGETMANWRGKAAMCEHGKTTGAGMYDADDPADEAQVLAYLVGHRVIEDREDYRITIEHCGICRPQPAV